MDSGVCVLSPLSGLTLIDSSTVEVEKAAAAQCAHTHAAMMEMAEVVAVQEEVRCENVEAYEQRIQGALCTEMSDEDKAKAQERLRCFLLHNPNQRCLVRRPSEKFVVEKCDAVEQIVKVLADAEFAGAPEAEEPLGAVGAAALTKSLASLFEKVHQSLPLLTVAVGKRQHHFMNTSPHPSSSQEAEGALENKVDTTGAKHSSLPSPLLPPFIPETCTLGAPLPPPVHGTIFPRGVTSPPRIPRSIPLQLLFTTPCCAETSTSNS